MCGHLGRARRASTSSSSWLAWPERARSTGFVKLGFSVRVFKTGDQRWRFRVLESLARRETRFRELWLRMLLLRRTSPRVGLEPSISQSSRNHFAISIRLRTISICAGIFTSTLASLSRSTTKQRTAGRASEVQPRGQQRIQRFPTRLGLRSHLENAEHGRGGSRKP